MQGFNINLTSVGPKTCNRGEEWGTYKDVVNCNTCRLPGLRVTKESIWGFFEGQAPEDRLGLPLERSQAVRWLNACRSTNRITMSLRCQLTVSAIRHWRGT